MRRHFGWNKTIALGLGGALALLKQACVIGDPSWVSYEASVLVERIGVLAAVCFGTQLIAPAAVLFRNARKTRRRISLVKWIAITVLALSCVPAWVMAASSGTLSGPSGGYVVGSVVSMLSAWLPLTLLESRDALRRQGWYRRLFLAGEGASAGMASAGELRRRRFRPRRREGTYGFNPGLLLGKTLVESTFAPFGIRLLDELGTLLIGSPRSGKSVRFLWQWMATNDQVKIVVDPKAHGLRLLAGRLSDPQATGPLRDTALDTEGITRATERLTGGVVLAWDPFGLGHPYRGASINAVLLIDPASDYCRVMLSAISQSIVIPSGDEQHWVVELTRLALDGMILHLRTSRPLHEQSLGFLADLFSGLERVEGDARRRDDFQPIERLIGEMRTNPAGGGICISAANAFASLEGREVGIVVSEIARSLKSFTDPVIRSATSGPGIDLRAVVESCTPVTLFLSLPFGALVEHNRVLRVIVSCLLRLTEQRSDQSRAIHFFLDEFAAYAKNLTAVRDAAFTLAGAGARLHIALQYIQQLRQALGPDAASAFEAGSNTIAAGVGDQHTAEYLSERFGKHKVVTYRGWWPFRRVVREQEAPVLDTATIRRLLDRKSRVGACLPGSGAPFLFETLAHRPLRLHGTRMGVWELPDDAFDEHLLATERGQAPPPVRPQHGPPVTAPPITPPTLQIRRRPTLQITRRDET